MIRAMETGGEYPARRNWVIARNVGDDDYIVPRADVVNEEQRYACHRQAFRLEDPLRSATRPYKNGSFDSLRINY